MNLLSFNRYYEIVMSTKTNDSWAVREGVSFQVS